jgi:hypothetical protein
LLAKILIEECEKSGQQEYRYANSVPS